VDSITDLGVVLDSKMTFKKHIDVTIAKGFAMLGFIKRLSKEFQDPKIFIYVTCTFKAGVRLLCLATFLCCTHC
jgi:hypothetical protein